MSRALRLLAGALGGYAFSAGFVAVIAAALPRLGMPGTESATLGGLLGVLVYLAVLIWVVASTRPFRTAIHVAAAAAFMIGTAPMLAAG